MARLEAFCSLRGEALAPDDGSGGDGEGQWGSYQSCQQGEVVCGMQSKFGRQIGVEAANFFCCPLPEDFYDAA